MARRAETDVFRVVYSVPRQRAGWELSEEKTPESVLHDEVVALVKAILAYWAAGHRPAARVARNLAVRWDEGHPQVGVDPDVCVLDPAPPDAATLDERADLACRSRAPRAGRGGGERVESAQGLRVGAGQVRGQRGGGAVGLRSVAGRSRCLRRSAPLAGVEAQRVGRARAELRGRRAGAVARVTELEAALGVPRDSGGQR